MVDLILLTPSQPHTRISQTLNRYRKISNVQTDGLLQQNTSALLKMKELPDHNLPQSERPQIDTKPTTRKRGKRTREWYVRLTGPMLPSA